MRSVDEEGRILPEAGQAPGPDGGGYPALDCFHGDGISKGIQSIHGFYRGDRIIDLISSGEGAVYNLIVNKSLSCVVFLQNLCF